MQHSRAQGDVEMSLREHLMAAGASAPPPYPPTATPHQQASDAQHQYPPPHDGSQHEHHLDPNVAGQHLAYAMSGDPSTDDGTGQDARKGKRELSTSKRAAQNRAAQRAFRQRKEGYIKKLEEQVKEFQTMEQNYKALQNENYQLREYILNLQSRLLENHTDFPPPPSHVNLTPNGPQTQQSSGLPEPSNYGPEQQLRHEMEQRQPPPPSNAPQHDGITQLQQAAASQENRQSQQSPYGLGGEYPAQQPEPRQADAGKDAKPQS